MGLMSNFGWGVLVALSSLLDYDQQRHGQDIMLL